MGKSYKKTPIIKDNGKGKKWQKAQASRTVRRKKIDLEDGVDMATNGNGYKKEYESWDITDWVQRWTKEEAIEEYDRVVNKGHERWPEEREYFIKKYPTLESWINYWEKCMHRK